MKSIFIPLMGVTVFANHKIDQLTKFYDGLADLGVNINDEYNCATSIENELNLLCDAFEYCEDHDMYGTTPECVDKDAFRKELQDYCGEYDTFKYELDIHTNKNTYDNSHISLTFTWQYTLPDDPCTYTEIAENIINFNDNGLITKFDDKLIGDPSRECPSTPKPNGYGYEQQPEPEPAQVYGEDAKHQNIPEYILEFYRLFKEIGEGHDGNCQTRINAIVDLFDNSCTFCQDDDCIDLEQWKVVRAKAGCDIYTDIEYTLTQLNGAGDSYSPSLSYMVDYELRELNGCTTKVTRLEIFEFNDQGLITKRTEETIDEPSTICPMGYGQDPEPEPPVAVSDHASTMVNKAVIIDVLANDYDPNVHNVDQHILTIQSFTQGKKGEVVRDGDNLKYIPNIDECGSDKFIYTIANIDNALTDSTNVHIDIACPQVPYGIDIPPMSDYNDKQKENLYKMNDKFGHVLCRKDGDKMSDEHTKQMFCDNMKYEVVCDEDTKDCAMLRTKLLGKQEFLVYWKSYENIVDEVEIIHGDMNMMHIKYRKGQCQGEYRERVEMEYDSDNKCISKLVEYMGDVKITDKNGDTECDNSAYKLMEKLENECTFDPEPNQYIPDPAPVYEREQSMQAYGAKTPKIDTPPIPDTSDYDGLMVREYKNVKIDAPVDEDNVLYGGYMKVTNPEELKYIESDILALGDQIRKETAVDWATITLADAYTKDISENRIRYRCALAYAGPMPKPVQQDNGDVTATGGGVAMGWIEYDVVLTNKNHKEKDDKISAMNDKFGRVMCKKDNDKMNDMNMKQLFCENMEYEAICNDDNSDDCAMFKAKLHGRQAFLDYFTQYEDLFDEAVQSGDDQMMTIKWRKGQCQGEMKERNDLEYDSYNGCISKWTEYIEEMTITDKEGVPDCDNSPAKLMNKVVNECTFDPEPAQAYGGQMARLPPVAVSDYASTTPNEAVVINVLHNDYSPNDHHVDQHVLTVKSFTQGKKGEVVRDGDNLKYIPNIDECGSDKFIYTVGFIDDNELTDSTNVHIDIACPQVPYEPEPVYGAEQPMEGYGAETPSIDTPPIPDTSNYDKEKQHAVTSMNDKMARVMCKKDNDKMNDGNIKQLFCENMEYESVCNDDNNYDCSMFRAKLHGRQAFLNHYAQYEDLFDEAVQSGDDKMTTIKWRKGHCQGEFKQRVELEYDSYNGCISKWTEYIEGMIITDKDGEPDCDNSASKLMNKVVNECAFDPEPNDQYNREPVQAYGEQKQRLPPVAVSDYASTTPNEAVIINVLHNDYSPNDHHVDQHVLTVKSFTQGSKGEVVRDGDNLKYIPHFDECGSDKFIYTVGFIVDNGLTDSTNVHIDIACPQAPYEPEPVYGGEQPMQGYGSETPRIDTPPVPDTDTGYSSGLGSFVQQEEDDNSYTSRLVKKEREDKLKSFYDAAFECRLKQNAGNTEKLDKFMSYLGDTSKLCVSKDDKCYNKNEIREMMGDRYSDDNESIHHKVDIISNDGNTIHAKCTSQRRKSNGCIVIKEEYDECLFNSDGSIKEFTVIRSNKRTRCTDDNNGNSYGQE